ncbi:MAG: sulfotransferase [Gammaproteobacteria bacterium]|nr:sulfotransferase [Gammaproteobacteria bacterium]
MLVLFSQFLWRSVQLLSMIFRPLRGAPFSKRVKRFVILLFFVPALIILQLIHWVGFLIDEILFFRYRKVSVRQPVFVLGVPRSGTTTVHKALAQDTQYTSFKVWECLFAPSITERYLYLLIGAIDRVLGRPVHRLISWLETHSFKGLEDVHDMQLSDPEEDYLALMPVLLSFVLVVPFPQANWVWQMGFFDRDMSPKQRQRVTTFYRRCLQKHLFVFGKEKTLLSKNASFASMVGSLAETFADARFISCMRAPVETVPSQISSIAGGMKLFGNGAYRPEVNKRFIERMQFYYHNLLDVLPALPADQQVFVNLPDLKQDLRGNIEMIYQRFGIVLSEHYNQALNQTSEGAREYVTKHRYSMADFGLSTDAIEKQFSDVESRYDFGAAIPEATDAKNQAGDQSTTDKQIEAA